MVLKLLGQAGVEIILSDGMRILVDPYLSDTLHQQKGEPFARLIPPPPEIGAINPDVIAITHDHADHLDMASLAYWLDGPVRKNILGPLPVYRVITQRWPGKHNAMVMRPGVEVSLGSALLCAVPVSHETCEAVGYLLKAEGKTVYFSGDTLFTRQIPKFLEGESIDAAFICINGFGNNMNPTDAARLVRMLKPKLAIPVHWDMFAAYGTDPKLFVQQVEGAAVKVINAYASIEL